MRSLLLIDGMRTVHCVRAVFQALAGVPGVTRAEVVLGQAEVEHDDRPSDAHFAAAVEFLGYRLIARQEVPLRLPVLPADPA